VQVMRSYPKYHLAKDSNKNTPSMNENEIREDPARTHTDILDISDVNTEAEERDEDDIEQIEPTYTKESQELLKGVMTK